MNEHIVVRLRYIGFQTHFISVKSGFQVIDFNTGSFSANIFGFGNITVRKGCLQAFNMTVRGFGNVDASGVKTQKSNLSVLGSGDITVGHVVQESVEKHSKNGVIKILSRG
jgi:hypothetical protein